MRQLLATLGGVSNKELIERWQSGDRCLGVFSPKGEIAHICWLHFGSCYIRGLGLQLHLDASDCYLYGVVTNPAHRGKGIYRVMQQRVKQFARTTDIQRMLQLVEDGNEVPLKLLPTIGYNRQWIVHHYTLLGTKHTSLFDASGTRVDRQIWLRRPKHMFQI